jgi:hypothetical protein
MTTRATRRSPSPEVRSRVEVVVELEGGAEATVIV